MKDDAANQLAYIQARAFRESGMRFYDSKDFIARFLRWPAKQLDNGCEPGEAEAICGRFLDSYSNPAGTNIFWAHDGLFWMGYMYRLWQSMSGIPSPKLCEIAEPEFVYFKVYRSLEIPPIAGLRKLYCLKGLEWDLEKTK